MQQFCFSHEDKRTHRKFVQTNNATVIDKGKFKFEKLQNHDTLQTNEADDNSEPLLKQYPIHLHCK